ncbi:MAG: response regulator transcription factor [Luteolibacter sp.]
MRCLVIEDFSPLRESIEERLREEKYVVDSTGNGEEGLWYVTNHVYDVVILDIMLPGMSGLAILEKIRESQDKTPVIVISAKDAVEQRVEGLDRGADDYLIKPFAMVELSARVRALSRRRYDQESTVLKIGDLTLDTVSKSVVRAGREIPLTPREYAMLHYLIHRRGHTVPRKDIWEHVYQDMEGGNSNSVDVYIAHLRRKLNAGGLPDLIRTRRGYGYTLTTGDS